MKIRAVDFVGYYVSDLKKSVDFYTHTLGLNFKPEWSDLENGWAEFDCGNVTFDLLTFDKEAIGKCNSVGFAVADVKQTLEELKKKNVKILMDIYETPVCFLATIADPDGNKITLHQRKDGTAG